jgi:ribonuclease D
VTPHQKNSHHSSVPSRTAHFEVISTPEALASVCEILGREKVIAWDTEFIRETTFFPMVELLQIASRDQCWVIDVKAFLDHPQKMEVVAPLLSLMRNPEILKIVHAAQGDQESLFTAFEAVSSPTFDTAVGASLCGYGDSIGLGNLVKNVLGVQLNKGHSRTNWSVRPLPKQLIDYALDDVKYLVEVAEKLLSELDRLNRRKWAMEISAKWEDTRLFQSDPEEMARKLAKGSKLDGKGYGALRELMRWRESRVRVLNLPRRWVAEDQVLTDLAKVRPKDLGHLGAFRGLNKGEIQKQGQVLLDAIRKGEEEAPRLDALEKGKRPDIPDAEEAQVLSLLQCYVGILADEHQLASRHLMTSAQLLPLFRSKGATVEDWVKSKLLSEEAAALVGSEIHAFLAGKRALTITGSRIKVVTVSN